MRHDAISNSEGECRELFKPSEQPSSVNLLSSTGSNTITMAAPAGHDGSYLR